MKFHLVGSNEMDLSNLMILECGGPAPLWYRRGRIERQFQSGAGPPHSKDHLACQKIQYNSHRMLTIRRVTETYFDAIWKIFSEVVSHGDTYAYAPETTPAEAREIWLSAKNTTYVACDNDDILGTYILRPNQPGLGSHVANAGYMVRHDKKGQGVGRAMCEHSLV